MILNTNVIIGTITNTVIIIGAISLIGGIMWKGFNRFKDTSLAIDRAAKIDSIIVSVDTLSDMVKSQDAKIDLLLKEFKPNGGTSLKDSINRLEKTVNNVAIQCAFNKTAIESHVNNYGVVNNSGYVITNVNGDTVEVGNSVCRLLGRSASELSGKKWINYIHPLDRESIENGMIHALETKNDFEATCRIALSSNSNKKTYISINNSAKRMEVDGVFVGYYVVISKI